MPVLLNPGNTPANSVVLDLTTIRAIWALTSLIGRQLKAATYFMLAMRNTLSRRPVTNQATFSPAFRAPSRKCSVISIRRRVERRRNARQATGSSPGKNSNSFSARSRYVRSFVCALSIPPDAHGNRRFQEQISWRIHDFGK